MSGHVKVLNHSTEGKIYALADVHGMKSVFDKVCERLSPNDRLIVVGDLTDRGPDNVQLIESIIQNNADPTKAKIHAVLGNHEAMVLNSIKQLEGILKNFATTDEEFDEKDFLAKVNLIPELQTHFGPGNGGKWLLDLFADELFRNQVINVDDNFEMMYAAGSKIKMIKDYFATLPYIIRVAGSDAKPAINFLHADMPFNDGTLKRLIYNETTDLDDEEVFHLIWARPDEFDTEGKDDLSALTIAGHNIILFKRNLCVRAGSNTINCDIGTYISGVSILLNLTDGRAEPVGTVTPEYWEAVAQNLGQINNHLELQKKRYALYQAPYLNCKTFFELNEAIADAQPELIEKTLLYLFNNDALTTFGIHTTEDLRKANVEAFEQRKAMFEAAQADSTTEDENTPPEADKKLKRPFFESTPLTPPAATEVEGDKNPKKPR